jgi:allantoin racemase
MKICCQLPVAMPRERFGGYYDLLMQDYTLHKNDDTEIVIKDVETGISNPALLGYYAFRIANDLQIARSMVVAAEGGADAVAGAAYIECGARIAGNLVGIPVVEAPAAAMRLAGMIGEKVAVVTSEPVFIPVMLDHIHHSGFASLMMGKNPVRSMDIAVNEIFEDLVQNKYDRLMSSFLKTAGDCVKDGADVIIVGCGLVAPILSLRGVRDVSGAPLIDPLIAALKAAEMLASLHRAGMKIKPDTGLFAHPGEAMLAVGMEALKSVL